MNFEQTLILVGAVFVGVGSLVGALAAWRALARVGHGLEHVQARATERASTLPAQLVDARNELGEASAQLERTLWALESVDARLDRATAEITAKRAASDRLRVRLITGQLSLARLRELVRLAMRLSEIRRAIL